MLTADEDRKTTPKRWQGRLLFLWYALFVYFLACGHFAMNTDVRPGWTYLGGFHMFTTKRRTNYQVTGDAFIQGRWEPIDLEAMYPTRWESGHRYQRGPFRRSKTRMATLAASTCKRHDKNPQAVRFFQSSWRRQLGTTDQSVRDPKVKNLVTWRCGTPFTLPNGEQL